jgi:hypothetical protein
MSDRIIRSERADPEFGRLDEYDPYADLAASLNECYRAIRERIADGGPPWAPQRWDQPQQGVPQSDGPPPGSLDE